MGLESDKSKGVHPEDIVKALQGFLKEGHKVRKNVSLQEDIMNLRNRFEWFCYTLSLLAWLGEYKLFTCLWIQFNPVSPVSVGDEGYKSDPSLQEQTFCLVYIMAADKVSIMNSDVIKKMQSIREKATELGKYKHHTYADF